MTDLPATLFYSSALVSVMLGCMGLSADNFAVKVIIICVQAFMLGLQAAGLLSLVCP